MENKKEENKVYLALNLLYEATKKQQEEYGSDWNRRGIGGDKSCKAYLKEFCTIKICAARRSGHTTAIKHFLNDRPKENWMIITENSYIMEQYTSKPKPKVVKKVISTFDENDKLISEEIGYEGVVYEGVVLGPTERPVKTIKQIMKWPGSLRGYNLHGAIIDCASFLSSGEINHLYEEMAASLIHNNGVIIFVE